MNESQDFWEYAAGTLCMVIGLGGTLLMLIYGVLKNRKGGK